MCLEEVEKTVEWISGDLVRRSGAEESVVNLGSGF